MLIASYVLYGIALLVVLLTVVVGFVRFFVGNIDVLRDLGSAIMFLVGFLVGCFFLIVGVLVHLVYLTDLLTTLVK